jgi:hypothetical protein
MKNQWMTIIGTCFLLLSLSLGGCDKLLSPKPDHITVNVMIAVYVNMVDAHYNNVNVTTDGIPVTIFITKNGSDRLVFQRIMQTGLCQATGIINLAKGQYIECNATVQGSFDNYFPVAPGYAKLAWDTANASTNYGDMYDWYPHLTIQMKQAPP